MTTNISYNFLTRSRTAPSSTANPAPEIHIVSLFSLRRVGSLCFVFSLISFVLRCFVLLCFVSLAVFPRVPCCFALLPGMFGENVVHLFFVFVLCCFDLRCGPLLCCVLLCLVLPFAFLCIALFLFALLCCVLLCFVLFSFAFLCFV